MRQANKIGLELELAVMGPDGQPQVAGRYLDATKEEPLNMQGNLIHKDASMVELAMRPATSPEELASIYAEAYGQAMSLLPDNVTLMAHPTLDYSSEELALDEYASIMGCSASANVYGLGHGREEYDDNRRFSGMHVNIEVDDADDLDAFRLDCVLGLYSVMFWEQGMRPDVEARRRLYGMAGEHRIKDFGIEYRTLPSCAFDPAHTTTVWELVNRALNFEITEEVEAQSETVQHAIQYCSYDRARRAWGTLHKENPICLA